ncbi:hypothetical protein VitviT2T_011611 [Vitis vinifera]|uniref:Uncharacterized protein n=1 Tax=Vitis vinifera TaxID=29760 RepID=A0ABY9CC32_VITVI|nr:hypothetical protein VitviT2T_011611 [Vitis vinifera]
MLPSARSDWLAMAATSSFQLRIVYRLKHWIFDFLSFEMVGQPKQLATHMDAPPHEAACSHFDDPTKTIEARMIRKSEQLMSPASSLAKDIATLRSQSSGR